MDSTLYHEKMYDDSEEDLPPDMPSSLGASIQINAFVDSNHAGDQTTTRS